ncbi:sensor histidine kinase [Sporichthya sp.]|uniref:sensor histidine kinase n=1 Tax=Sporichthya sp. TaxID=65475 RepID=UPI0017B98E58|nr:histidine kinase [Sporichthya sp.]MBA3744040.1 histidine kinase [Sporichthya sp.]
MGDLTGALTLAIAAAAVAVGVFGLRRFNVWRPDLGTSADQASFETLHLASLAAPSLRGGLTQAGTSRAIKPLRTLLGSTAVAITDGQRLLAWDGEGQDELGEHAVAHAQSVMDSGRSQVLDGLGVGDHPAGEPIREVVVTPLVSGTTVIGTLAAYVSSSSAGLIRAVDEVGSWVSGQLELAELDATRTRVAEAEVRALRAQISPHFIYNSLNAIASFVRTDPDRARELLLEFADFTRYTFRRSGDFTTLADELRAINGYLLLERARFGERLNVTLRVAPEVLAVSMPFLCLQPLVENAVRHGLETKDGQGTVTILAEDAGAHCLISVEDDGVGMAPERVREALSGEPGSDHVGLGNVDERLRTIFGDEYGLTVATAPGAGTKVSFNVPKFQPGVHA